MKNWSLKQRLTTISSVILLVAFSIIFFATQSAYSIASKNRLQESMNAQFYALMAIPVDENGSLFIPDVLRNDRLENLSSGLVAYVLDETGGLVWQSPSSELFKSLPEISASYTTEKITESIFEGRKMFWVGDSIIWEHENKQERTYYFIIGEKQSILSSPVNEFMNEIFAWLSISGVLLLIVFAYALNFSLRPLANAQQQIELVRLGEVETLEGDFPDELQPLTSSINLLLKSETRQKNRFRDSLGNLAHSLKTPLAILKGEVDNQADSKEKDILTSQISRIDDIVRYQLNRSVVSSGRTLVRTCSVEPEIRKIVDALQKVYLDKNIEIISRIELNTIFPGDAGDLLELVGNLSENACKWATSKVVISAKIKQGCFNLYVDDDGAGIAEENRDAILNRGKRLDQSTEGQGLGLSIVMDILKQYNGDILIEKSALGGSLFRLTIPLNE